MGSSIYANGRPTMAPPPRQTWTGNRCVCREVAAARKTPSGSPPAYDLALKSITGAGEAQTHAGAEQDRGQSQDHDQDVLPPYSCDLHLEGVFERKMEMENATRRAEDRQWGSVYAVLHGTAFNVYECRKERGWRRTKSGPGIAPDNPPWVRRGLLEKSYSLAYAEVGVAADYKKRRYVIRVRAETDQFLISCVELETFVGWLDGLFAAISVAAPIDERDFPLDHSMPRTQRMRWLQSQQRHGQARDAQSGAISSSSSSSASSPEQPREPSTNPDGASPAAAAANQEPDEEPYCPPQPSRPPPRGDGAWTWARARAARAGSALSGYSSCSSSTSSSPSSSPSSSSWSVVPAMAHAAVDTETGKWTPQHRWTSGHDMVYARLCYAALLLRSPRRSNYVVRRGRQWSVDWATGRMARVSPPRYGEVELLSPGRV